MRTWQTIGSLAAFAFCCLFLLGQNDWPNLVLITADDMNWDSIGVYGSPVADATPNLDQLALSGMRFQHAHVNVAVCAPSRAAIMTGLYPHQSGATAFAGINENVVPISVRLKQSGYGAMAVLLLGFP